MSAISIQKLTKSFGAFRALFNISLEVQPGEIFGFLGPNGAGKTTTIGCILDLLHPDSGKVTINGLDSQTQNVEIKKIVGYVPTDPYFYSGWSGKEHLDFSERLRGAAPLRNELIKAFDFDQKIRVGNLSTGNKQKLSLIMAMMHQPQVLILDEPTRGLDPLLQNKFYEYIRKLKKSGTAVFMSSHNLAEIEAVCERVAIIKSGELVEVAGIKDMQGKRIHIVSASFVEGKGPSKEEVLKADKDIEIISKLDGHLELKVTGDLNSVLRLLAQYEVVDLSITHASLEDIFLEFYK